MSPVVVLVGPPGAGKSTVARKVGTRLSLAVLDTDAVVEAVAGRRVADIFTTDGEDAFRAMEEQAVTDSLSSHDGVLSLGGGAVLSARTRAALHGHLVVLLEVGMTEGIRRTGMGTTRPLLAGINPRATYRALLEARMPLYREVATHVVNTDRRSPGSVAADVAALVHPEPGVGEDGQP
ncbi:MAG: shikimate kinase [Mycobacteriaceae bacterium]